MSSTRAEELKNLYKTGKEGTIVAILSEFIYPQSARIEKITDNYLTAMPYKDKELLKYRIAPLTFRTTIPIEDVKYIWDLTELPDLEDIVGFLEEQKPQTNIE
ncbi:hypothetical protein KAR91_32050 [Candidatus Pacearchaeota archaeon]|nr:hypothetical protein [Candidatus Pacearchaeota archaeon]